MASASEQVDNAFNKAFGYANTAQTALSGFTAALNTSIYAPPTINVTWNSLTPPSLPGMPAVPDMPAIEFITPSGEPAALDIELPSIVIDDFTEAAPTLSLPSVPTISYGAVPALPEIGEVVVPDAPTITMPDVPSYLTISPVSFSGIDLHEDWLDKLEEMPELVIVEPTPYSYARGPEYASELLAALQDKISARLSGGSGLDPAVEQALWDRARSRETKSALANEAEIMRTAEAQGFSLPSGVLASQLRGAQQNYFDKLGELSRDIAIKQADLEQENLKQTIDNGLRLEGMLVDYSYKLESLTFEASKVYAENAIQIHAAAVDRYKALLAGYQTYAANYKTLIDAETAKIEIYKAQLQGEQTKAQINESLVQQYKAQIEAGMSSVEIYKAQVGAASTLVQLEQAKIGAAGEQIRGYVAQVNAETSKVEAYKASVQAQAVVVDMYKTRADAFGAKVSAQAERARAQLGRYNAMVQAKVSEWEAYKARVQAEGERIRALGIQSGSLLDGFKAEAAAVESEAKMHTSVWETQIREYEASQTLAIQATKLNNDAVVTANGARLDAAKVGAQVYAQLTSSAYSMINATANISASGGTGVNYSYTGKVSGAVSPITSI